MKIDLAPHGQSGVLLAICGFDGSGKSTLEEAMLAAIAPTRSCVSAWAPSPWWRSDANVQRTLFGEGTGRTLPEESLLLFNLADCYAHQAHTIVPALARGEVVLANRYLFDMLALFEARGLRQPAWIREAAAEIVRPDACIVLDGSAATIVDRVVKRDGESAGRFDQDVAFVERYNASLRRMAHENDHTVVHVEASPDVVLQQCLTLVREAGWV